MSWFDITILVSLIAWQVILLFWSLWSTRRYIMIHKELTKIRETANRFNQMLGKERDSYRYHMKNMAEKVDNFSRVFEEWNSKKD